MNLYVDNNNVCRNCMAQHVFILDLQRIHENDINILKEKIKELEDEIIYLTSLLHKMRLKLMGN